MKLSSNKLFLIFLCIFFFHEACFSQKAGRPRYNNKDSAATISIHPNRPFRYGFAFDAEQVEGYRYLLKMYNIRNGETVADIGAASGWLEGVFSVMTDSVTYYVQDIDTVFLNEDQLGKVVKHFSAVRSSPQTNHFKLVIGNKSATNLPNGTFDRIIINNSFHEFQSVNKMLSDIKTKLKPNGKVIVGEPVSTDFKRIKHPGCRIEAYTVKKIVDHFSSNGLYLTAMSMPENAGTNFLTFELSESKAREYGISRKKVEESIRELDKLNERSVRLDSSAVDEIVRRVRPHAEAIVQAYTQAEYYLNQLGYDLLGDKKTAEAIAVLKINTKLFPDSFNVYDSLGEAYMSEGNFLLSLNNYKQAILLDPNNANAKKKVAELEQKLSE